MLILYTDGLVEAEHFEGEFYPVERLEETALAHLKESASAIADAILRFGRRVSKEPDVRRRCYIGGPASCLTAISSTCLPHRKHLLALILLTTKDRKRVARTHASRVAMPATKTLADASGLPAANLNFRARKSTPNTSMASMKDLIFVGFKQRFVHRIPSSELPLADSSR